MDCEVLCVDSDDEAAAHQDHGGAADTVGDHTVIQFQGISITARDLTLLEDKRCLNDSILNFFLKLVVELLAPEPLKGTIYVASTFFLPRLMAGVETGEQGWEGVRRWTRSLAGGPLGQRYMIIPVNDDNVHWWLIVICHPLQALEKDEPDPEEDEEVEENGKILPRARIVCLDSSLEPIPKERIMAFLRGYLWREYIECFREAVPRGLSKQELSALKVKRVLQLRALEADVPKQANWYDCGVFIVEYLLELFQRPTALTALGLVPHRHWFGQRVVSHRRAKMQWIATKLQEKAQEQQELDVKKLLLDPELQQQVASALTERPNTAMDTSAMATD